MARQPPSTASNLDRVIVVLWGELYKNESAGGTAEAVNGQILRIALVQQRSGNYFTRVPRGIFYLVSGMLSVSV